MSTPISTHTTATVICMLDRKKSELTCYTDEKTAAGVATLNYTQTIAPFRLFNVYI